MISRFTVEWIDHMREPRCAPDPAFPNGKDLDLSNEAADACCVTLPYPARRRGLYIVACNECGLRVGVTTAGRPDDPRSVTIPCRRASCREQRGLKRTAGSHGLTQNHTQID